MSHLPDQSAVASSDSSLERLRVLVLYDDKSTHIAALVDQLEAFKRHSAHEIHYCIGTTGLESEVGDRAAASLAAEFDAIIIHHSVRLSVPDYLNPSWAEALATYEGRKILFLQDEYEGTECARRWIGRLGIDTLFSCVPSDQVERVYPRERFPRLVIKNCLTGYVPEWAVERRKLKPLSQRRWVIGYRGRELPWHYGDLAREKFEIGVKMKMECERRGIVSSIEWDTSRRIYGRAWFDFIEDSRATLGTESGSNIFDEDGSVQKRVCAAIEGNPDISYAQVHASILQEHEGRVALMNQISPRIFEAVMLGSALVLFEGGYSGILVPDEHFIPLKKDFSNVDEVLARLDDLPELEKMTSRAYERIIASGKYGYDTLVARVDACLAEQAMPLTRKRNKLFSLTPGTRDPAGLAPLNREFRQLHLTSDVFHSHEEALGYFDALAKPPEESPLLLAAQEEIKQRQADLKEERVAAEARAADLWGKIKALQEQKQQLAARVQSLSGAQNMLWQIADSKWAALLRLLGLRGRLPKLKNSERMLAEKKMQTYLASHPLLKKNLDGKAVQKSDAGDLQS